MITRPGRRKTLMIALAALAAALAPSPDQGPTAEMLRLAEARAEACAKLLDFYRESAKAPAVDAKLGPLERFATSYEPIETWSRRLADARLDAAPNDAQKLAILAGEVERIQKFEGEIDAIARGDAEWGIVATKVLSYRLEAQYRLEKAKAGH